MRADNMARKNVVKYKNDVEILQKCGGFYIVWTFTDVGGLNNLKNINDLTDMLMLNSLYYPK